MTAAAPEKRRYRMVARAHAAAATRNRLLEAAWDRFSTGPFEDIRLTDVAAAAGVSAQTLHTHFGTKEGLFVAAWDWKTAPEAALRDTASPGDMRAAVRVLYDTYDADGDAVLRVLTQEERIPEVHERAEAGRRWHREWVERTLGPLIEGAGAKRERRLIEFVVATDLLVWKLLRREMGLDRAAAERIVIEMITASKGAP
jgi:AcrR family transcriptional regulator